MTPGVPLVEVSRFDVTDGREVVESVHSGHLVVTDGDGEILGVLGDPATSLFVRSTAKPFQALACLEALGDEGDGITPAELAVAWASHRGEPAHIRAVLRLLERSATDVGELTCPPAVPDADPAAEPARVLHNCSGKHALFALAGRALGVPRERLLDPASALQRAVLGGLNQQFGSFDAVGIDGCGAPAIAVPLVRLARAYASLAGSPETARIREAGLAHPGLVGGAGRPESALLAAGVVAKVGAEGSYAVGWLAHDGSPRGLAVRAADGATRGSAAATVGLLAELGVVPVDTWSPPPPLGGGVPAGVVRPTGPVLALASGVARAG